jgi:hypothetical protein
MAGGKMWSVDKQMALPRMMQFVFQSVERFIWIEVKYVIGGEISKKIILLEK